MFRSMVNHLAFR